MAEFHRKFRRGQLADIPFAFRQSLADDGLKNSTIFPYWTAGVNRGPSPISLGMSPSGQISSISMQRWGNPDGGAHALYPFGGFVDEEATWAGYTIPSKLRIGWHFGTDRFEKGEFFRVTITHAEFK